MEKWRGTTAAESHPVPDSEYASVILELQAMTTDCTTVQCTVHLIDQTLTVQQSVHFDPRSFLPGQPA